MARKVNIIIPSSLSEVFEQFIARNVLNKYECFTCGTPLLTRYRMGRNDLFSTVLSIEYGDDVKCSAEQRRQLLYCIARDLLDPVTIIEP